MPEHGTIVRYQDHIEWLTRTHKPFEVVEEEINAITDLNDEQKSALWLYAWALMPEDVLKQEVAATMQLVG